MTPPELRVNIGDQSEKRSSCCTRVNADLAEIHRGANLGVPRIWSEKTESVPSSPSYRGVESRPT